MPSHRHASDACILWADDRHGNCADAYIGNVLAHCAIFAAVMSRNRFLQILRYLHVNDEAAGDPNNVKLCKVQEFINIISENCSIKYSMGCHI